MNKTQAVVTRTILGISAAVLLSATTPLVAYADDNTYDGETYCGTVLSGASPAEDPFAAFNDMSNDFYDSLLQKAGGTTQVCGPYHWVIEQGAKWVVKSNTPAWLNFGIKAAGNGASSTNVPAVIPDVGPSTTYPVSWTGGQGLWLRGGPGGGSSKVRLMPEGARLAIVCQTHGQTISSAYATTDLWDKVTYDGITGFASDAFIDTNTNAQVAPTC